MLGNSGAYASMGTRKAAESQGRAKNVIFMVSDGMNMGALTLAKLYRGMVEERQSRWLQLYRERAVVRCLAETYSANSVVTDSAAAASAWGGGERVNNGMINVRPDGSHLVPMLEKVHGHGMRVGLVTTATVTHATPAGFAANVSSRGDEEEIARQYFDRKVDVMLGGGRKFFSPELRAKFVAAGYDWVDDRAGLKGLPPQRGEVKPLLGLFSEGFHAFDLDRKHEAELEAKLPTLSGMTSVALERLQGAKDGFFLVVEGARIDHAGHANDAAALIHDQLAFDDAVGTVRTFVEKNPETLLIITTDHGCGGIQMNGVSADPKHGFGPGIYNATTASFLRVKGFKRSLEWMKQSRMNALSGSGLGEMWREYTGQAVDADQVKSLQGLKLKATSELIKEFTGLGWTSANHTGELVEFCALGPGSHLFSPYLWNSEVHGLLLRAMEIG